MMPEQIETERLVIRPFTPSDVEEAFGWLGDPDVMSFTPAGTDKSLEITQNRIASYMKHHAIHGFSKWMMVDRITGEAVGDAGLLVLESSRNIDLGFRIASKHWGKGLATEAASAWIRTAISNLHLNQITAIAHPENHASHKVLNKVGFQVQSSGQMFGMEVINFLLDADNAT